MSIRSNTLGHYGDVAPELQAILRKNGMQAHIIMQGNDHLLAVQGHDSPLLTYKISVQQLKSLTDGGTNSSNKQAYNTFTDIVANDFYMPKDFVHARNANGRVVMGLHGYRIGVGEYGRPMGAGRAHIHHPLDMWHHHGILGWTPRQQEGFHMRRVGGALFMQGAPMVPDRPDGRRKPGELLSGGYGFYYKEQNNRQQIIQKDDILKELSNITPEIQSRPRPKEDAKPYKDQITSNVYFSNDKWQEVLTSHGIVVDADKKTLTIQSAAINKDFVYDLTDEEIKKLTSNSINEVPVQSRIDLINEVIKNDYSTKISMDMLNTKELIHLDLNPEVIHELRKLDSNISNEQELNEVSIDKDLQVTVPYHQEKHDAKQGIARVHGESLYEMKDQAWYREGKHGREVTVGEIKVEPVRDKVGELEKDNKGDIKYRMTAVINGEAISHEITQKQYDKFMAVDDYHRMKLFSKVFHEVDMKNVPQENKGFHFGAGLLAALTIAGELVRGPHHHPAPNIYMERHGSGHVYMKPGVDSPKDIACRAFEAGVNAAEHGVGLGR